MTRSSCLYSFFFFSSLTQACYGIQPSVTLARRWRNSAAARRGAFDKALAFSDKLAKMTWLKIPSSRTPRREG